MEVLDRIPELAGTQAKERAERILTNHARQGDPKGVTTLGIRALAYADPDGHLIANWERQRMRGVTIGRQCADGMFPISGLLSPQRGALLMPVVAKLARPGMCNPDDPDSPWTTADIGIDTEIDDGDDSGITGQTGDGSDAMLSRPSRPGTRHA